MRLITPLFLVVLGLWCTACAGDKSRAHGNQAGPGAAGTGQAGTSGLPNDFKNSTGAGSGGAGMVSTDGGVAPLPDPHAPPFVRDDTGMGKLDKATLDALKSASAPCGVTILYPYEHTVFPGGLPAPRLMFKEGVAAVYLQANYDGNALVDYRFATGASNPGMVSIPQDAWNQITRRTHDSKLLLTLGVKIGSNITSCKTSWQIAPGNMTGSVYYNTYDAPASGTGMMSYGGMGQGAVMRLALGQTMSNVYLQYTGASMPSTGPCTSCHSLSFDGSGMVASTHNYALFAQSFKVYSYPVTQTPQPMSTAAMDNATLGALTPDGKRMLTMGNPDCTAGAETFPRSPNNFPLVEGPDVARMQDTATGKDIQTSGLDPKFYMWMPQFSPDGKHVVFNHAKPDGKGGTDRRELAIMDYDSASNTFSNLKVIVSHLGPEPSTAYSPMAAGAGPIPFGRNACGPAQSGLNNVGALNPGTCDGPCYPAFPFFTPDSKAVIFSMTSEPDFANSFPGRDTPAKADLWYVDIGTKQTVRLDAAVDAHDPSMTLMDFYPTVMPVAVGGYFWMFWTSRRDYGTQLTMPGSKYYMYMGTGSSSVTAIKKRIWVSAITPKPSAGDVMASTLHDPSHPGFYLDGQSNTGNIRAFATLNPCLKSGETCQSGLDCCTGYCSGEPGVCSTAKPACAKTNEKCATNADCCPPDPSPDAPPANTCIGGFCGFVTAVHVQ